VQADDVIDCRTLRCKVPAHVCVMRQNVSQIQRTRDTWRGQASRYPHCMTERCAQGRGVRAALEPDAQAAWKGSGPAGLSERLRDDVEEQRAARRRLEAAGLLDDVRTIDVSGDPVAEGSEDEK
jgi:hypothetical protein